VEQWGGRQVLLINKMAPSLSLLDNSVFRDFAFFSAILGMKCLVMSLLTSMMRLSAKVYTSPEDYVVFGKPDKPNPKAEAEIERIRNAHRNDMENVYPFFFLGFIYCFCNPDAVTALWLFRIFTAGRICHTIVYLNKVRQPFRGICYAVGQVVNFTLCGLILKETVKF